MRVVARLAPVVGLAALMLLTAVPAHGTPIVSATVTPVGTVLHYNYSILFDPSDDEILVLTVTGLVGDATLVNEVAPAGFGTDYDFGLGLISFLPSVGFSFPTAGTLSGFGFDSLRRPAATTFEALTLSGAILTGPTTGPVGPPIPEPATILLLATGLGVLGRRSVRKRP